MGPRALASGKRAPDREPGGAWSSMADRKDFFRHLAVNYRQLVLVLCLVALAAPSQAAQKTKPSKAPDDMATRAQMCRAIAGREAPEATDGRSHEGQLNVQRFSDCLMGKGIGR